MADEEILLDNLQPIAGTSCATTAEVIESQIRNEPSKANFFSNYRFASAAQICVLLLSVCCAIVAGAAMPLVSVVFGELASEFISEDGQASRDVRDRTRYLTLLLVYIAIGSFVTTMISTWGFNVVGEHTTRRLQARYLSSVLRQNMAYFDMVGTGELMTQVDQDMKLIQAGISHKVGNLLSGVSGFVVAIICAFVQNARFASIMISQPLALVVLVGIMGSWLSRTQQTGMAQCAQADNLAHEILSAMRNIIAYRSQNKYARKYHDRLLRRTALDFRERLIFGVTVAGSFSILHWANGLGFWQADHLFRQGHCTIPQALTVLYATTVAGSLLCQALPFVVDITKANGAAKRVFTVIERISPIDPMADSGRICSPVRGEIRFEDVSFAYPSRPEQTVLEEISFHVPAGHTVALIGPSGSGKSTVFALIERLYNPLCGSITVDDEPIDEMNLSWLRSEIGYVGQDVTLFRATLFENIASGLPNAAAEVSLAMGLNASAVQTLVVQAAQTAQIDSFIMSLPQNYGTVVDGSSLSGGQRQRLAIARAIISQPSILLLDEATAALDSESEKEVQEALGKAAAGRTMVVIAHRLSTVQNADTIIVMQSGRILDQGSHAELISSSVMYQELVKQQELRPDDECQDLPCAERSLESELGPKSVYTELPKSSSINHIWHLNKPELPNVVAGTILSVLAGITYPVQAIFFGNGIMSIVDSRLSTGGHSVRFWARMYLIHGIIVFTIYCARGYCFAVSASQLQLRARSGLFKALLLKSLPFLDHKDHSIGALVSFLSSGTPKIVGVSGTSLGLVVESIVMLATGITVGCIFGWKLGIAATATVPLIAMSSFLQYYIEAQVQKHVKRDTAAVAIAQEAFSAIKTVTVLNLQRTVLASFEIASTQDTQGRYWAMSAAIYACTTSLRILSIAFVFWYGGTHLIATGEYTIQQFFICFAATVWGSQSAAALFAHAPDIAGAHAAASQLTELVQSDNPQTSFAQQHKPSPTPVPSTTESLALRQIHFRYPTRPSQAALNGITLHAPAGAFIALVGTTGCGKSSVLNLVERFYAADAGGIMLGNRPIEDYDLDNYRGYLALVDQNPCLVGEDLRECLQSDERIVSDGSIMAALEHVGLADFVGSLPQGLDTPMLGNGSTLSGGQRQRMAIAKAFLWNPKILLLDEATSALDSASEQLVQRALQRTMKGRTTIAVAHRLKTIVNAHVILVLDHGRIVERGTHDELMRLRGKYWRMARLQQLNGVYNV
ncbi:ATP-binding cassette transporter [Aspergillus campestris IBT 28561]|uniref:ATP-binding cassette transporter n=1 Tax=Aspergillus campestris (strain IBT 28561) TaxID=1392248 RepID=A0A2I1CZU9_ASPC2|nr:ATP-binding cassette transporter [Aspergillus campestris IBT 28561]PKY03140.1 ATP-binding cassette transporter [Aspergillus campestris IBT 28561]